MRKLKLCITLSSLHFLTTYLVVALIRWDVEWIADPDATFVKGVYLILATGSSSILCFMVFVFEGLLND